ncbi:hypothetical protein L6452_16385 [Arctium lappa]|uniref:Uncharacterized protein n=1 Tax=Arctium lappa TaxID=4217 RepID=A0ACB9C0M4_ARCLA|nr:hypothetical protein L6452_16385 [Arctium lappa]
MEYLLFVIYDVFVCISLFFFSWENVMEILVNSDLLAGKSTKITTTVNAVVYQQHHIENRDNGWRRISATKACENPTALEIGDCCGHLKIPFAIELDKAYPRDFMQVGRVRVLLKRPDGSLHNPGVASKKQLMIRVAELVPRHPGRTKKQEPAATSSAVPTKSGKGKKKR